MNLKINQIFFWFLCISPTKISRNLQKLTKTNFQKIQLKLRIIRENYQQKFLEFSLQKYYSNNAGIQQQGSKQIGACKVFPNYIYRLDGPKHQN